MKHIIFTIQLYFDDNTTTLVSIATPRKSSIETLVARNKHWFELKGKRVTRFTIENEKYLFNMNDETYENELSLCDIVDDNI